MKVWQYLVALLVAILCVGLSIATVLTARSNQRLQQELQMQQVSINNSILGQQGQQVSANLLQDMGLVAVKDSDMRQVLEKHGIQLQLPATGTTSNAPASTAEGKK